VKYSDVNESFGIVSIIGSTPRGFSYHFGDENGRR